MNEKMLNAIKELKEKSVKRNFSQTFDLIISLKEFDIKKPENKLNEEVQLPNRGEESKVVVFSDSLKNLDVETLASADVEKLVKNKRLARKLVRETDFFLSEAKLMPLIGKSLGQLLAPRGKMPKLITGDVDKLIKNLKNSIRVRIKDSPVVQCLVGNESMGDEGIAENIETVLKFLNAKLPKGKNNIGRVLLKKTMSKPIKLEV